MLIGFGLVDFVWVLLLMGVCWFGGFARACVSELILWFVIWCFALRVWLCLVFVFRVCFVFGSCYVGCLTC